MGLSLGTCRLVLLRGTLSLDKFQFFFRSGTFIWDLSLGNFRIGSFARDLGNWAPEAAGTEFPLLGEPGGAADVASILNVEYEPF